MAHYAFRLIQWGYYVKDLGMVETGRMINIGHVLIQQPQDSLTVKIHRFRWQDNMK